MTTVRRTGRRAESTGRETMSRSTSSVACTITDRSNCARARARAAAPMDRARSGSARTPVTAARASRTTNRDQVTRDPLLDHLAQTADIGADGRESRRHRLEQRHRQALHRIGRQDEDVHRGEHRRDVAGGADERRAVRDPELTGECLRPVPFGTVTGNSTGIGDVDGHRRRGARRNVSWSFSGRIAETVPITGPVPSTPGTATADRAAAERSVKASTSTPLRTTTTFSAGWPEVSR